MKAVADATPLIALAKIGEFDLLRKLFGRVIITPHVHAEVVTAGAGLPGARETVEAAWVEVRQVERELDFVAAQARYALGIGELSSLACARNSSRRGPAG